MTPNDERINQLLDKLEILLKRQENFSQEINALSEEIYRLKYSKPEEPFEESPEPGLIQPTAEVHVNAENIPELIHPIAEVDDNAAKEPVTTTYYPKQERVSKEQPRYFTPEPYNAPKVKSDIEKFIGENLINKIGIVITVIGVAIGAKYSIEHELISPLTRIILGYLVGLGLLGFGIKLKKNYENYSAVLVSGAISIMYFITYAAYGFYELIPQAFAFMLMVVFTAFSVVAAINYNKQVIAHIGLVGAYAVPFLLSDGSGKVLILFSYMAIINIGILIIAIKKYWKPIYYSSFFLTWLIFFSWYTSKYEANNHYGLALTFIFIFFATFYVIFLAYKLLKKEKYEIDDILLLLANSFLFFGLGYSILGTDETGNQLLGMFALCNAIIHFIVSVIIYRQRLADRNLFYLVAGLVLAFITIAMPIQLDGNWVTLIWACEAALLFWLGRTKNINFYEKLSYALMFLAFVSLVQDWSTVYDLYNPERPETRITPLLNINFLTSLLFIVSFGFINILNRNPKYHSPLISQQGLLRIVAVSIPAILLVVIYYSFRIEISTYWHQLSIDSALEIKQQGSEYPNHIRNTDLSKFESVWIINYSLLFVSILSFINIKRIKDRDLGYVNLALNTIALLVFLVQGLYLLGELRESFLSHTLSEYYQRSSFNIAIRYISFAFAGLVIYAIYRYIQQDFIQSISFDLPEAFDILLYATLIWILSSELIAWMDMAHSEQSYKLGLSILWGVCALLLIALGIWKKKKHLRIGAIVLFAVTLIKLFFYDIADLDTIAKTIVFVSLGVLLLIISFLYNKYKHLIAAENEN